MCFGVYTQYSNPSNLYRNLKSYYLLLKFKTVKFKREEGYLAKLQFVTWQERAQGASALHSEL